MKTILISIIRLYQKIGKSLNVHVCRFYPTCSEYTIQSINKNGTWTGLLKGINRLLRCNPFNSGGYDPVK